MPLQWFEMPRATSNKKHNLILLSGPQAIDGVWQKMR